MTVSHVFSLAMEKLLAVSGQRCHEYWLALTWDWYVHVKSWIISQTSSFTSVESAQSILGLLKIA